MNYETVWDDNRSPEAKIFLQALVKVCREHGKSIAHEDGQGAFIVDDYNPDHTDWLLDAHELRLKK